MIYLSKLYINSDQYCTFVVSVRHTIELSLTENDDGNEGLSIRNQTNYATERKTTFPQSVLKLTILQQFTPCESFATQQHHDSHSNLSTPLGTRNAQVVHRRAVRNKTCL